MFSGTCTSGSLKPITTAVTVEKLMILLLYQCLKLRTLILRNLSRVKVDHFCASVNKVSKKVQTLI